MIHAYERCMLETLSMTATMTGHRQGVISVLPLWLWHSIPEKTEIDLQLEKDAAEQAKGAPSARDFGRGSDGLAPSLAFAGRSQRGGPKGVRDDYMMAKRDLERQVRPASAALPSLCVSFTRPVLGWCYSALHFGARPWSLWLRARVATPVQRELLKLQRLEMFRVLGEGSSFEGPSMAYGSADAAAARAQVAKV